MGGSPKPAQKTPPIQSSSKDEENFIQYVRYKGRGGVRRYAPERSMADTGPQRVFEASRSGGQAEGGREALSGSIAARRGGDD